MGSSFETISCQGKENFRVTNQLAYLLFQCGCWPGGRDLRPGGNYRRPRGSSCRFRSCRFRHRCWFRFRSNGRDSRWRGRFKKLQRRVIILNSGSTAHCSRLDLCNFSRWLFQLFRLDRNN